MWPTLFQWGPFQLKTLTLFVIVALVVTAFTFWRKCREEHYSEEEIFDGFLLSGVFGFIGARVVFVLLNLGQWGLTPLKWFDLANYPGLTFTGGMVVAAWYLRRFAQKKRWDVFEVLDYWVTAVVTGLTIFSVGLFFDGSFFGTATNLPWGIVFPGVFDRHHPLQLYWAAFYVLLAWYLTKVEYRYRTYNWYRAGRNTAQTGFLTSTALIFWGLFQLCMLPVSVPSIVIMGWNMDPILAGISLVGGMVLLFIRSGRSFFFGRSSKARPK